VVVAHILLLVVLVLVVIAHLLLANHLVVELLPKVLLPLLTEQITPSLLELEAQVKLVWHQHFLQLPQQVVVKAVISLLVVLEALVVVVVMEHTVLEQVRLIKDSMVVLRLEVVGLLVVVVLGVLVATLGGIVVNGVLAVQEFQAA
jgi:hypothetical protein